MQARYRESDEEILRVEEWIVRAGDALLTLWDEDRLRFIRETVARDDDGLRPVGHTSTSRSLVALVELSHVLAELSGAEKLRSRSEAVIRTLSVEYIGKMAEDLSAIRHSVGNGQNMFTDSHLVLSAVATASYIESWPSDQHPAPDWQSVQRAMRQVLSESRGSLHKWCGGKVHELDSRHDFVTLAAVRAFDFAHAEGAAVRLPNYDAMRLRVENDVGAQLGWHVAGVAHRFDPGELAFSFAVLERLDPVGGKSVGRRVLNVLRKEQTTDGAFPTSRVISYGGQRLLHVASTEVALSLVTVLLGRLRTGDCSLSKQGMSILRRSLALVTATYNEADGYRGWANDRTRSPELVESWATALVLSFLIRYREYVLRSRQESILDSYVVEGRRAGSSEVWGDFSLTVRRAEEPVPERLRISDPSDEGTLAREISKKVLRPIVSSSARRPDLASFIVPGPPGTRKTSLLREIARALAWPFVLLSPSDFLMDGLEGFERNAAEIFEDLMRLKRVVVLFDESEDFFLRREPGPPGARTSGAFITPGMLPRLQALRDEQWLIFALATNETLDRLDEAALRPGRFDAVIEMPHPSRAAQKKYVERNLDRADPFLPVIREALALYDGQNPVTWYVLDRVVRESRKGGLPTRAENAKAMIEKYSHRTRPPNMLEDD